MPSLTRIPLSSTMPSLTRVTVTENRVVHEQRSDGDIIGSSSSSPPSLSVVATSSSPLPTVATTMGVHSTQFYPPACTTKTLLSGETQNVQSSTPTLTYRQQYTNKLLHLTENEIASEGRYLRHEGRRYIRSSNKNSVTKYRCLRYLPGGLEGTAGAKWCTFQVAKRRNPCAPPHRCSGVLSVNSITNEKVITIAHECTHSSKSDSVSGGKGVEKPITAKQNASKGGYLRYGGGVYTRSTTKDDVSRYRCFQYRPGGSDFAASGCWSFFNKAKSGNPDATPHRCPGVLNVNNKTNEYTITVAHECTLASTTESVIDGGNAAAIPNQPELLQVSLSDDKKVSPGAELKNIDLQVPEQIVFGEVRRQGYSPEAIPSSNSEANSEQMDPGKNEAMQLDNHSQVASISSNMDADGRDTAIVDLSLDDGDDHSVSSNKDFYKDLCARLTAALNKRKITEKVAREENKRLKKELKRLKDRISE